MTLARTLAVIVWLSVCVGSASLAGCGGAPAPAQQPTHSVATDTSDQLVDPAPDDDGTSEDDVEDYESTSGSYEDSADEDEGETEDYGDYDEDIGDDDPGDDIGDDELGGD
jgi:hypothetical protein